MIDLGEIERINSCGVRDWVNWLEKLETNGTRSVLVECSPAIVAQINLVNNFTGSGVVKSFYVPYFCPECDEEKVLLVEASDMGPPPHEPPTCRCDECDLVDGLRRHAGLVLRVPVEPAQARRARQDQRRDERARARLGSAAGREGQSEVAPERSRRSSAHRARSKPSVPSLPSIQRTSTAGLRPRTRAARACRRASRAHPSSNPPLGGRGSKPPSQPRLGGKPPSSPQIAANMSMRNLASAPAVAAPGKSNALVFTLVGILVAAIVVLAYLVLTK